MYGVVKGGSLETRRRARGRSFQAAEQPDKSQRERKSLMCPRNKGEAGVAGTQGVGKRTMKDRIEEVSKGQTARTSVTMETKPPQERNDMIRFLCF